VIGSRQVTREEEELAMLQSDEAINARGASVLDQGGTKIGAVEDIYLDRETERPEWVVVKTGLLGNRVNFVPLRDASMQGEDVLVPYDKKMISGAPSVDADGELSQEEEAQHYGYYGLEYSEHHSDSGLPEGAGDEPSDAYSEGREASGATTNDAMTRSEEELTVGKAARESGRARLKKYVITEDVTETVPVQREEVRIEREPITDANIDQATAGNDISEQEHEVTLMEEEVVTEKRAVPKERVRLAKETVTEEQEVSEQVRKEQIEGPEVNN
jgi:uncharacterized protein (TIGR02271 family)